MVYSNCQKIKTEIIEIIKYFLFTTGNWFILEINVPLKTSKKSKECIKKI
jgi:hypothetical protein